VQNGFKGKYLRLFENHFLTLRRRTMILADDPSNRHACAVTLFLAMATADGAFDGITGSSDLYNLSVPVWPVWGSLPIRSDLGQLPILRRVAAKSRMISSHAIKGTVLHKMMQTQIERSGYTGFSAALQLDIKHAVRREQRREFYVHSSKRYSQTKLVRYEPLLCFR
jgi:hypothetical protein